VNYYALYLRRGTLEGKARHPSVFLIGRLRGDGR
jgi:hypothetical protein